MKKLLPLFPLTICLLLLTESCKKDPPPVSSAPTIASVSPNSGFANTSVTITGTNFKAVASDNTVQFNGTPAAITSATTTTLVVTAPSGGTTGPITVKTSNGTATGPIFTYQSLPVPTITSISPASGPAGTTVTITGANFDATAANDVVRFNGVTATVTSATTTSIVAAAPAAGTTGNVTVTTNGGTSNGVLFTYATGHDVYIVGQDGSYAALWKNGVKTVLGTGGAGRATAVFVSGSDVYVAGIENSVGKYWKNGVSVSLPGCISATGITVAGPNVYVSGLRNCLYLGNVFTVAAVWLNGVRKDVAPDTTKNSVSGGLVYAQNDIFASAWYYKQFFTTSGTDIQTRAFYYPPFDGIVNFLTDDKTNSWATCMGATPGGSVLVGGYLTGGAVVWSNGLLLWQDPLQSSSEPRGIAASDSFISVAGTYTDQGTNHTMAFVKNIGGDNAYTVLNSGADANYNAQGTGVAVDGKDVYVSGTNSNDGSVYWKNGVKTVLPHSAAPDLCGAFAIFISKN